MWNKEEKEMKYWTFGLKWRWRGDINRQFIIVKFIPILFFDSIQFHICEPKKEMEDRKKPRVLARKNNNIQPLKNQDLQ